MSPFLPASSPSLQQTFGQDKQHWLGRFGPLVFVIVLHLGFFHALQGGLRQPAAAAMHPREIMITLIAPPAPQSPSPPPAPIAQPEPAPPKPPTVQKPPRRAAPKIAKSAPKPVVDPAPAARPSPAPQSIATPPPAPAEPVAATPAPAAAAPTVASAAPSAPAAPRTVSTGIECPQLPQPEYPALSRRMGEEGKVMLRILLNEKGRIAQVEIQKSSGYARLDEAARQAVLHASCKPYLDNGKAVPVFAVQPIAFRLDS